MYVILILSLIFIIYLEYIEKHNKQLQEELINMEIQALVQKANPVLLNTIYNLNLSSYDKKLIRYYLLDIIKDKTPEKKISKNEIYNTFKGTSYTSGIKYGLEMINTSSPINLPLSAAISKICQTLF